MKRIPLVLLVLLSGARDAFAAGTELADQGAAASGTANAATARSGDPSAAFFNPAALVDGKGLRVGVGATLALAAISAKQSPGAPPPTFDVGSEKSLRAIPYLSASYAYDWFAFGLSINVPFGGGVTWPKDWPLRFEAVESQVRVIRVAPFIGVGTKRAAIAIGPHFDFGTLEVKRATNHVLEEGSVHIATNGSAVGGQVAGIVRPLDEVSIGVSYKTKSVMRMRGDGDFDVPATFAQQYPDQGVDSQLRLPERFAVGVGWAIAPPTRLYADFVYTGWSTNELLVFDFQNPQTPDSTIKNEWRDSIAVRVGAEHDLAARLTLRGGVFVDGASGPAAPAHNLSPTSPDMTRIGGSIGGGYALGDGVALDAFYQLFVLAERASTSADYPLATYNGLAHLFGLGARFAWDSSAR